MSYSTTLGVGCGCNSDCVNDTIQDCEHTDPGTETSGSHLPVFDYLFNERRLTNGVGFLMNRTTGGGSGYAIAWTLDPAVPHTALNVALNETFNGLLAAVGSAGNYRRITPTVQGFLQANADGTFQIVATPTATVPDPLVVTTLSATTATFTTLTVNGVPTFAALAPDTITQNIGLNAANELVIGSVAQGSVAKFHESVTENDAGQPNIALIAGDYIKYTSEIFDSDNIASPVNNEKIKIDVAGTYEVRWGVGFGPETGQQTGIEWTPRVGLEYNGSIVSYGDNRNATFSSSKSCTATGVYVADLAVNDFFQMKITGTMPTNAEGTKSGVWDANLVLTRIK